MNTMNQPVAIDLFSGCGGLTLGLKWAGFKVVGAIENDPLSVETYRENHKEVQVWPEDIREVSVDEVLRTTGLRPGELDLLAGCPPCQGFSSMRTLNGSKHVDDPRNDLVFDFLRFVIGLRPKTILMENVPSLIRDSRMLAFQGEMQTLGYFGEPQILNAADYGVPQRRRRMVFVGSKFGLVSPAAPATLRRTVREAIGLLKPVGESGDPLHDIPEARSEKVMSIIQKIPKDGGSRRGNLGEKDQLPCHRDFDGFKDVYARMKWDDVSPTITSGCINPSKGRFLHPEADRAISLREAALLQSFPPDYRFSLRRGKYSAALLIGNALPPEFVRIQAASLLSHICEMEETQ